MAGTVSTPLLRGAEWLLQQTRPAHVFTPERLTDEHRLIARTVVDFLSGELLPVLDRVEPDGSFVLNGDKMWITNGGFAALFIAFAKVDGQHFNAFIVERAFAGVTSGKEEHKMGLHGSSTTAVFFEDVRVPSQNVLGE